MEIKDRFKMVRKMLDENGKKCSQADFGAKFGLSRDAVANIENGRVIPSELLIKAVCEKMDISEDWLRDGLAPMRVQKTRDEEISELVGRTLKGDNDFKKSVIQLICSRTDEELDALNKLLREIYENL